MAQMEIDFSLGEKVPGYRVKRFGSITGGRSTTAYIRYFLTVRATILPEGTAVASPHCWMASQPC